MINTTNNVIKTVFLTTMIFFSIVVIGNTINSNSSSQITQIKGEPTDLTKRISELFPLVDFTDLTSKYQK